MKTMTESLIDSATCLLTASGLTMPKNSTLYVLSLISTILGITIAVIRNIVIPVYKKIKEKTLQPEDIVESLDKTKDLCDDLRDDGKINNSHNKNK